MSTKPMTDSPHYNNLVDQVGTFIEYWGFKQVHGKIWALIFLSPGPVDANMIKKTLGISKALTSMSLKELLHFKVIQEVTKDKPGTQKYCINPNITDVVLDVLKKREHIMLLEIQKTCNHLQKSTQLSSFKQIDSSRLENLIQMVDTAEGVMQGMLGGGNVDFEMFEKVMTIEI